MTRLSRTLLALLVGSIVSAPLAAQPPEFMGPPAPPPEQPPTQIVPAPVEQVPSEAALASATSSLEEYFGRFLPRVGYSYDGLDTVGRDGGLSAFQVYLPVWQDRNSTKILFSDSRLLLFDSKGSLGANLGLGGRLFSETLGRTLGGYVYWDYSDTGRASFNQVSGGLETLGDRVDARANFYVPVGKDRKQTDNVFTPAGDQPYFQNSLLLVGGGAGVKFFEQALYGFDTEAGLKVVAIEGLELRAFAGMYHYQGEAAQQAWGPRGRIEARLRDSMAMGVSIQNDRLFGTTVNFNCLVSYGRMSGRAYSDGPSAPLAASDRLGDPVVRTQHVAVDRQRKEYVIAGTPVVDPRTNQPYVFLHVAPGGGSDGSFESPYATLAAAFADPRFAGGNVVVYDRSGGTFAGNVTFAPGTRLLSAGPVQMLNTPAGQVMLPFSGSGMALPKFQGTIAMASHSTVSGFDLTGVGPGAIVSGDGMAVRDVTIAYNRFSGQGTAIWLPSVAGRIDLHHNQMTAPGAGGIVLGARGVDSATIGIRDSQITQPIGDAVAVTAYDSSRIGVTVERNMIEGAEGNGVLLRTGPAATATINAKVRENSVVGSATNGSGGVALLTTGKAGGSRLNAVVSDNDLMNNFAPGVTARASGPNSMAIDLFNNKALSSNSMFGFLLQQQKKAAFSAVDPSTIGSRNAGSVSTAGAINDIAAVPKQ